MKSVDFLPEKLDISVSVASGVESVLKKEIARLGYGDYPVENGILTLKGSKLDIARLNVNLRTADRVYIKIGEFPVFDFDGLFDNIGEIYWENYLPENANISVNGKCVKSKLFSISDCQKIIKKSIANRLCKKYKLSVLPENGSLYEINFSIFKDKASIFINTSGAGLHKRGYRDLVGIAPIKETLASALLLMSDFYYKRPFFDPFCGSGTMVIEGARIALNIAPGIDREFAFSDWENFEEKYLKLAKEEARDKEERNREIEFYGYDIDKKAISLSNRHAIRAGLNGKVNFEVKDVKNFKPPFNFGTIVTNPPYGERVYDIKEAEECYANLGKALKGYDGISLFLITASKSFERYFGKKADRKRKMYNSNKECNYYFYYGKKGE